MAITKAQVAAMEVFTASEQVVIWGNALANGPSAGVSYSINGRSITRPTPDQCLAMYKFWVDVAYLEANPNDGGAIALVRYGDAR